MPLDKDDWTTQVAKIVAAKPDFIFNTINGSSNVGFIKAYYDAGLTAATTPIISVSIAEEEAPAMGHEVTGHYASWNYFQSLETPTPTRSSSRAGRPTPAAAASPPTRWRPPTSRCTSTRPWSRRPARSTSTTVNAAAQTSGITFDAPEGTVTLDGENHHISKPGHIGQINADNQFDIVWSSDEFIEPDPFLKGYDWFPADVRDALVNAAG